MKLLFIAWDAVKNEFIGCFDDKDLAISACYDDNCGIGPAILNEALPEETDEWEGFWFPRCEREPVETLQKIYKEAYREAVVAKTPSETGIDSSDYITLQNGRMYPRASLRNYAEMELLASALQCNDEEPEKDSQ